MNTKTNSAIVEASEAVDRRISDAKVQRIVDFRDELDSLLPSPNSVTGPEGMVIGKFRQAVGNLILWYGQWEKNRDYSSAINASMALGKLSSMNDLMPQEEAGSFNTSDCDKVAKAVDKLCTECWDRIQAATGRIVPFEKG